MGPDQPAVRDERQKLGIEAFDDGGALVARKGLGDGFGQPGLCCRGFLVFQLDDEQLPPGNLFEQGLESRRAVAGRAVEQGHAAELAGAQRRNRAFLAGQAFEIVVVKDHRLAVSGKLHVAFDGIASGNGRREGGGAVLNDAIGAVM